MKITTRKTDPSGDGVPPHLSRQRGWPLGWGIVAACLLLGGCSGATTPDRPPTPLPAAVAVSPTVASPERSTPDASQATPQRGFRTASVAVGEVVWTAAIDPTRGGPEGAIDHFEPDAPSIIAAVPIDLAPAGTRLSADWRYNNVPLQGLSSEVVVDADGAGRWVSFSLTLPPDEAWPTGTYEIRVAIDQQPALRATIDVAKRET